MKMNGMKKIFWLSATLLFFVVAASCRAKRPAAAEESMETTKNDKTCKSMLLQEEPILPASSDIFDIDTAWISNSCMHIAVSYGGGCGTVDFQLIYSNRIMKSYPPKTSLFLAFTDDDPCRAIVKDTLHFDLGPFEAMARAGGLYLNLGNYPHSLMFALPLH
jgi:hypothetical protein